MTKDELRQQVEHFFDELDVHGKINEATLHDLHEKIQGYAYKAARFASES